MASTEGKIDVKIAVEQALHKAIKNTAEAALEEYGIYLNTVIIDWVDTSTTTGRSGLIASIEISTTTKG